MKKILDEFYSVLQNAGSVVPEFLNKGLHIEDINRITQELEFKLLNDVIELFEWKNGSNTKKMFALKLDSSIFPLAHFVSLESCVRLYKEFLESRYQWPKRLFVIFDSMIGDSYSIDIDPKSPTKGMIFIDSPAAVEFFGPVTIFDSLKTCIKTQIECYKNGAYIITESNLEIRSEIEAEISKHYNKKSEYWKEL